jgi:hypothetical protein
MNRQILHGKTLKWIALAAGTLIAMQLYFVQQMIAALLLFTAVFACFAAVVLIFLALGNAWQMAFDWAAMHVSAFGRALRHGPGPLNSSLVAGALALERRASPANKQMRQPV